MFQVAGEMALSQRKAAAISSAVKPASAAAASDDTAPLKPTTPRVRWFVDEIETETANADKPVSVPTTELLDDRFWRCDNRAHSLPNLADDTWTRCACQFYANMRRQPHFSHMCARRIFFPHKVAFLTVILIFFV